MAALMAREDQNQPTLLSQLVGVHVAMLALAVIVVAGRITIRLSLTRSGTGVDEIAILLSLALAVAFVVINLCQLQYGFGQHVYNLPPGTNFSQSQKLFFFGEMVYYANVGVTKIAVLLLYLRIINNKTERYVIYGLMTFVALTVFSSIMANIFQCTPVALAWDEELTGTCVNRVAIYFSNAGLDIAQDILIYVLPIRVLSQLQLPRRQKIALIAIFAVGGFVVVTGIIRLTSLKTAAVTSDPTWYNVAAANWSVVEICVGIVCASLAHYRPLLSLLTGDRTKQDNSYVNGYAKKNKPTGLGGSIVVNKGYSVELMSKSDSMRNLNQPETSTHCASD